MESEDFIEQALELFLASILETGSVLWLEELNNCTLKLSLLEGKHELVDGGDVVEESGGLLFVSLTKS